MTEQSNPFSSILSADIAKDISFQANLVDVYIQILNSAKSGQFRTTMMIDSTISEKITRTLKQAGFYIMEVVKFSRPEENEVIIRWGRRD